MISVGRLQLHQNTANLAILETCGVNAVSVKSFQRAYINGTLVCGTSYTAVKEKVSSNVVLKNDTVAPVERVLKVKQCHYMWVSFRSVSCIGIRL